MSILAFHQVTFAYPDKPAALQQIDLELQEGEFHCLLGRSGCGKSTLLKLAAGLLKPSSGKVITNSTDAEPRTGFVFQSPALLEWKSVMDNVLLPISLHRKMNEQDRLHARKLLERVGLASYTERYPYELSGGQQSRVALARALLDEPKLLLLDEPFAALDALTREELQDALLRLCAESRMTVLFITHDIAEAVYLADRISVMEAGLLKVKLANALARPRTVESRASLPYVRQCAEVRAMLAAGGER